MTDLDQTEAATREQIRATIGSGHVQALVTGTLDGLVAKGVDPDAVLSGALAAVLTRIVLSNTADQAAAICRRIAGDIEQSALLAAAAPEGSA